ncbi:MAG: DUF917 domain-containing protein [Litorilituus sp.]|jgi:hypothetical protein|nr:DUF917 domain-containing protein [Litorilituus sp.]
MIKLTPANLEDYARGAALLGAGGGGDPYIGRLLAEQAITQYGLPEIISVDELDDNATVISIAMIGAPTVLVEKACSGDDLDLLIKEMSRQLGKKVDALMPIEIGGVNSCLPIVAAVRTGLPLVNCDGMGRAFPCLEMVTFNVYGESISPVVMTDEHGNAVTINTASAKKAENFARSVLSEMGLSGMISCYPMKGSQLKKWAVKDTMTCALHIGEAIKEGRQQDNAVKTLVNRLNETQYYTNAQILVDGKVIDVFRETRDGFSFGHCVVEPFDGEENVTLTFQNEFIAAEKNGQYIATVPDIIAVIDRENAEPITAETLRFGQRVNVLAMDVPSVMRTEKALGVFGPQCFGLGCDYKRLTKVDQ